MRAETVASTHNREVLHIGEGFDNIEIERFAQCTWFLRTVENGDALHAGRQHSFQILHAKGSIEVHADHTDLLSLTGKIVDNLASGLCNGTHADDDILGIGSAVIGEWSIVASGQFLNLLHIVIHNVGHSLIVLVADLTMSKEGVGILGHTTHNGMLGVEGTGTELGQCLLVNEGSEVVVIETLDFLNLMRSTEPIEEIHERYTALYGCQMGNTSQIHHLLHGAFSQHGEACLTGGHHILMVAEDAKAVRGQRTGTDVEHTG